MIELTQRELNGIAQSLNNLNHTRPRIGPCTISSTATYTVCFIDVFALLLHVIHSSTPFVDSPEFFKSTHLETRVLFGPLFGHIYVFLAVIVRISIGSRLLESPSVWIKEVKVSYYIAQLLKALYALLP